MRVLVQHLSLFLVFVNTLMSACDEGAPCIEHHVTIPRDCQSGRLLLSLEYVGQTFHISTANPMIYRGFAVLANGDVICTAANSVVGTVSFGVECRLGLLAWTELIHVTVADDHDEMVSFAQPYFEGHVVENAPPNTAISGLHNISVLVSNFEGLLTTDVDRCPADSDAASVPTGSETSVKVQLSICSGPSHMFQLASNDDGSVALRTMVELDFERQSQFLLTVVAVVPDIASTASARLRVYVDNINDNAPTLDRSEYHFRFDEIATGPKVDVPDMRVTAFDDDGDQPMYSIDGEDADEFFVDAFTGEFYFRSLPTNWRRRNYEFGVYADDGLHRSDRSVVSVSVDGRDRGPEGSRGRRDVRPLRLVEVPENMIGDVVDIGAGRRHEFFAFKEPAPRQLELGAVTGTVRVRPGERLDFETQPEIDFVVVITSIDDASGTMTSCPNVHCMYT